MFCLKTGRGGGFERLNIDLAKMESVMEEEGGVEIFGGGFAIWCSVWACKEELPERVHGGEPDDGAELVARTACGSLPETFNYAKLSEKLDAGEVQDPALVTSVLQKSSRCSGDMGQLLVNYYRKHNIPGRKLAVQPAFQWMNKHDRKIAFTMEPSSSFQGGKVFLDIDTDNCFPVLLMNEISTECDLPHTVPTLVAYNANYTAWRSALAKYMSVSLREAKQMIIKVMFLAKPDVELPFMWNLSVDVHRAMDILLAKKTYDYLEGKFGNRRCPNATKLHYALSSVGDAILTQLENELKEIPDVKMNTYIFDGAVVMAPEDKVEDVRRAALVVGQRCNVNFSVDSF